MHLIVAFAAPLSDSARRALAATPLPALQALLAGWDEAARDETGENSLSTPHERALAQALGWAIDDGRLPWAARAAAALGLDVGAAAWGLVTPVHCRVGSDRVDLIDAEALALDAADARALYDAAAPSFDAAGFRSAWGTASDWYLAHESLRDLATASLDRVAGRSIQPWLADRQAAREVLRLQSEVQMLWHTHPVNAAREAAGALPVNSFWLSGCGANRPARARAGLRLDTRLRAAALGGDGPGWATAWRSLDAGPIAELGVAAARGDDVRLTLCGERGSIALAPRPHSWWRRLGRSWAVPPALLPVLEAL